MLAIQQRYGIDRLGALSDGVFAVMLTLLMLDLKVPKLPHNYAEQEIIADLIKQIPNFIAWLISFLLVARFWITHHALLASLHTCHIGTITINFVILALISLVPFGSSLIGTYDVDAFAIAIFSSLLWLVGLSIGLFARHIAVHPELHKSDVQTDLDWHWRYNICGLLLVAVFAIGMAFVVPLLALLAWTVEPLLAFILSTWRQGV